jgi:peptidyl-prolyl cis-trans isomerase D
LNIFLWKNFYKDKEDLTNSEIENFLKENKDLLKREYIDFKYVTLNPQTLIGLEEFNQDFFDEIDKIENKISQGVTFESIIENINANVLEINEYTPSKTKKLNEDMIYSKRSV